LDKPFNSDCKVFTLSHLAVISVTGADCGKFLQGQLTCDINELQDYQAGVAAFCNAKGRVISTLLVVKTGQEYQLILPVGLLDKVLKKLQIYILRALVRLTDQSQTWRLYGLEGLAPQDQDINLQIDSSKSSTDEILVIRHPAYFSHFLCIAKNPQFIEQLLQQHRYKIGSLEEWRFHELSSGFPWFEAGGSEQYIPQMLNIDQLGGISFNKGCYTGQEIIARTHYLGRAKRHLFLADCSDITEPPACGVHVLASDNLQNVGDILSAATFLQNTRLLVVLQEGASLKNLALDDPRRTVIKLADIS
jgi:folate-binding protein YgfZ